MDLLKEFKDTFDNEYASIVSDGIVGDNCEFIDTGSYMLNAILSGSIYGGFASNKVTALAGEPSVGKSYFLLQAIKGFFDRHENAILVFFESESALSKKMFEERGIDTKRILFVPIETIQEFRTNALRALIKYEAQPESERPKLMLALDSLGNLSTKKEIDDIESGSDKRDMTRAQLIKGAFRSLTLKLGKLNVPMIITNHIYQIVGSFIPKSVMGGGSGLQYAASSILFLTKAQDKDGKEVVGGIITATMVKSRFTREKKKVKSLLSFETGLNKHYGLLEFGEEHKIFKKVGNRYVFGDKKVYPKAVLKNPEIYFTNDVMKKIDQAALKTFPFGSAIDDEDEG